MNTLLRSFGAMMIALSICASAHSAIAPAAFDANAIDDSSTLDVRVLHDWRPASSDPSIRQKLISIAVCEWWPEQVVRIPVTLNAPASGQACQHLVVSNVGLGARAALPSGAMLRLLKEHGVGVVLIGMGTIDAMEPVGKLHLGMRQHVLKTKDARYTPAWIWAMSDMRGLTAALAERDAFRPTRILVTGGSKRGIAAAAAAVHDKRVTAILPVVAPPLGNPAGPFVVGTESEETKRIDRAFLDALAAGKLPLPTSAVTALAEREQRRGDERITLQAARAAGWSADEIASMNDAAWDISRIAPRLSTLRERVEVFYNVGSNDNVSPDLVELSRRFPDFPLYIVPGGQHGGPTTTGFTRQTPYQKEVEDNLYAFAVHHFFATRTMLRTPDIQHRWNKRKQRLEVAVAFEDGTEPEKNELWWSLNRHPAGTLPFEYDSWQSAPLRSVGAGKYVAVLTIEKHARTIDLLTTHTHRTNGIPMSVSSRYVQIADE